MLKKKLSKLLITLTVLMALFTSTAMTAYGFIITQTESCTNTFTTEIVTVKITVNKIVKNIGYSSIGPENFEFALENQANGDKQLIKSDKNGEATFFLNFNNSDIGSSFTYSLYEVIGNVEGLTYDTTVYDIAITVNSNANENLTANVLLNGEAVNDVIAKFENIYDNTVIKSPQTNDRTCLLLLFTVITACVLAIVNMLKRNDIDHTVK